MTEGVCHKCRSILPIVLDEDWVVCNICDAQVWLLEAGKPIKQTTGIVQTVKGYKFFRAIAKFWSSIIFLVIIFYLFKYFGYEFYVTYDNVQEVRLTQERFRSLSDEDISHLLTDFELRLVKINWLTKTAQEISKTEKQIKGCMDISFYKDENVWIFEFVCNTDESGLKEAKTVTYRLKQQFGFFIDNLRVQSK